MTFLRNHAKAIEASDVLVTITASFQLFYVLVVVNRESRRLLHINVTRHPTAAWTLQQPREAMAFEEAFAPKLGLPHSSITPQGPLRAKFDLVNIGTYVMTHWFLPNSSR